MVVEIMVVLFDSGGYISGDWDNIDLDNNDD